MPGCYVLQQIANLQSFEWSLQCDKVKVSRLAQPDNLATVQAQTIPLLFVHISSVVYLEF